jgi:lactate dehydrogenase-like 2-hydroxyacid dehydrogenase
MKVLITRTLPDAVVEAARARFDLTLREVPRPMSNEESVAALGGYDAVLPTLGDAFGTAVFGAVAAPRCRLLANFGVGYNHIDAVAAKARGIAVTNTPGAVTDATADIAMMLILMSARRASEGERLVRSGRWTGWHPVQMLGQHVTGKTLAVIGMGRIGKAIARRAHHGFGMRIVFFNRSPVSDAGVPAEPVASVSEAVAAADFVVTAVPGGSATRHLIGAEALSAMQPHAHLINIARGDVVDEAALIAALTERRIAGAGLDVYEHEPVVPDALRVLDNVTLLPHLGTATLEVRTAMGMMAVDNLIAFAEGRALPNAV